LVWGFLHGQQQDEFDIDFRLPSECADLLLRGESDIGIVPVFELLRQKLEVIPEIGIACYGPVRSIVLVCKRPLRQVQTLAADSSSRSSVALARILLERRHGVTPAVIMQPPDLSKMLETADAALIIGDPALRLNLDQLPYQTHDLGQEWLEFTGLPMVFAMWAGRREVMDEQSVNAFQASCRFGLSQMDRIIAKESATRDLAPELVRRYLTSHIIYQLGEAEQRGMERFLAYAAQLQPERAPISVDF
jgi:predicted solute-binding protein